MAEKVIVELTSESVRRDEWVAGGDGFFLNVSVVNATFGQQLQDAFTECITLRVLQLNRTSTGLSLLLYGGV